MAWSSTVEDEYRAMLDGVMGVAFGATFLGLFSVAEMLIQKIRAIEEGQSGFSDPVPTNARNLTAAQAVNLWVTRVAWNFYMERLGFFPWRLRDKTVDELKPLLSFAHQGLVRQETGKNEYRWTMHSVWDVDPATRATEGILSVFLSALVGSPLKDEQDVVEAVIEGMRGAGWHHVSGQWEDYDGIAPKGELWGYPIYDFEEIADLVAGECHINSNYLVAVLRGLNIPAHIGPGWSESTSQHESSDVHSDGHCFIHFPTIGRWLIHGDNVQDRLLRTLPAAYVLRTEGWMRQNHLPDGLGVEAYHTVRMADYDDYTNWCLTLAVSPDDLEYDVPFLFKVGQLRTVLETAHIANRYAERDGAPPSVPPLFDDDYVDTLMQWVEIKLSKAESNQ